MLSSVRIDSVAKEPRRLNLSLHLSFEDHKKLGKI